MTWDIHKIGHKTQIRGLLGICSHYHVDGHAGVDTLEAEPAYHEAEPEPEPAEAFSASRPASACGGGGFGFSGPVSASR